MIFQTVCKKPLVLIACMLAPQSPIGLRDGSEALRSAHVGATSIVRSLKD